MTPFTSYRLLRNYRSVIFENLHAIYIARLFICPKNQLGDLRRWNTLEFKLILKCIKLQLSNLPDGLRLFNVFVISENILF